MRGGVDSSRLLSMASQSGISWQLHTVLGAGTRKSHTATLVGRKLHIYGGFESYLTRSRSDFLVVEKTKNGYSESLLEGVQEPIPHRRNGHTANLVDDRLFVFGGWSGFHVLTDVWIFDFVLNGWSLVEPRGQQHPLLNMHVSEYIEWMNCILCFGGGDGRRFENTVNCLGVHDLVWKEIKPKGRIPAQRSNASSCLVDSTCYIFGGWSPGKVYNDIHLLTLPKDLARPYWTTPVVEEKPPGRVGAGLVCFGGKVLLFGGKSRNVHKEGLFAFDIRTRTWRSSWTDDEASNYGSGIVIQVAGPAPKKCDGHTMSLMPDGALLVYGGVTSTRHGHIHTLVDASY